MEAMDWMNDTELMLYGRILDLQNRAEARDTRIAELEGEAEPERAHTAAVCRALGREQSRGYSADDIRRLVERIAALDAVVEKLPKTADGKVIIPGLDPVWNFENERILATQNVVWWQRGWMAVFCVGEHLCPVKIDHCYSTEQAARDAVAGSKGA